MGKLALLQVRTWVHDESVVLGIQDHRLPHIEEGMRLLHDVAMNRLFVIQVD